MLSRHFARSLVMLACCAVPSASISTPRLHPVEAMQHHRKLPLHHAHALQLNGVIDHEALRRSVEPRPLDPANSWMWLVFLLLLLAIAIIGHCIVRQ